MVHYQRWNSVFLLTRDNANRRNVLSYDVVSTNERMSASSEEYESRGDPGFHISAPFHHHQGKSTERERKRGHSPLSEVSTPSPS